MSKFETEKFSNESSEKEIIKNSDDHIEYCDVCFIAFGSQERRIYKRQKKFHLDCMARTKFQAKMMEKTLELIGSEISEIYCCPFEGFENRVLEMLAHCFRGVTPLIDS